MPPPSVADEIRIRHTAGPKCRIFSYAGRQVYSWGYGRGRFTNESARVDIPLPKTMAYAVDIQRFLFPPSHELQGGGCDFLMKSFHKFLQSCTIVCAQKNGNDVFSMLTHATLYAWAFVAQGQVPMRAMIVLQLVGIADWASSRPVHMYRWLCGSRVWHA